jgi:hypothetical protein
VPANKSGTLSLLRVHEVGTGYGPPSDFIDVEVVMQFAGDTADAFGFQLRTDANEPVRQGMLDLLRDAFNHGWIAHIDYNTPTGKHNGIIVRVWITKPPVVVRPPVAERARRRVT